ncbi:MAG TPA: hypothetical protein VN441_13190, partial [Syntrophomonas sp.]|nr:hypothetical protein [Syntrophomonas sp.]
VDDSSRVFEIVFSRSRLDFSGNKFFQRVLCKKRVCQPVSIVDGHFYGGGYSGGIYALFDSLQLWVKSLKGEV